MNRYSPHIFVLPEDDANRQMAVGFALHYRVNSRRMQVLEEAGGWGAVLDRFEKDHLQTLRRYPHTRFLLLLDFDKSEHRREQVRSRIPSDLDDRVFVLGAWSEPEDLRRELGSSLEEIGKTLAQECADDTDEIWSHELLAHNRPELMRLRDSIRSELVG